MTVEPSLAYLSPLDGQRFGVKTAKCAAIGSETIAEVLGFCRDNGVELLIARCDTRDLSVAQELERTGFLLMDTLLYYSRDTGDTPAHEGTACCELREAGPSDAPALRDLARKCFRDYQGHYHADRRLDRAACDEVYADWAYRSCLSREAADGVIVACTRSDIAGFGTMRHVDERTGEGLLFGVSPAYRGRGVYRSVMTACLWWCVERGLGTMTISTQITNLASRTLWERLGFEPGRSFYTFHRWFA